MLYLSQRIDMEISMHPSWHLALSFELQKSYFKELTNFVKSQYESALCFPPMHQIFAAFETPLSEIKVVIIGQDPYHGSGQAHGLCFSVNDNVAFPPSLRNIFEEIRRDIGTEPPQNGSLIRWANQGVFLLNATLTVREGTAGSHQRNGWEIFTDAVIKTISSERENVVFLLWGGYARKKSKLIDGSKHCILETGHPSPLSANKGHWFENKHFSKANDYLQSHGLQPIIW